MSAALSSPADDPYILVASLPPSPRGRRRTNERLEASEGRSRREVWRPTISTAIKQRTGPASPYLRRRSYSPTHLLRKRHDGPPPPLDRDGQGPSDWDIHLQHEVLDDLELELEQLEDCEFGVEYPPPHVTPDVEHEAMLAAIPPTPVAAARARPADLTVTTVLPTVATSLGDLYIAPRSPVRGRAATRDSGSAALLAAAAQAADLDERRTFPAAASVNDLLASYADDADPEPVLPKVNSTASNDTVRASASASPSSSRRSADHDEWNPRPRPPSAVPVPHLRRRSVVDESDAEFASPLVRYLPDPTVGSGATSPSLPRSATAATTGSTVAPSLLRSPTSVATACSTTAPSLPRSPTSVATAGSATPPSRTDSLDLSHTSSVTSSTTSPTASALASLRRREHRLVTTVCDLRARLDDERAVTAQLRQHAEWLGRRLETERGARAVAEARVATLEREAAERERGRVEKRSEAEALCSELEGAMARIKAMAHGDREEEEGRARVPMSADARGRGYWSVTEEMAAAWRTGGRGV
ncbi:hypothetical protein H9P43_008863 [Blastocladiella emersonii ATCC 22665]|nr:hypothetical protein H9P43_008863 [Blastocladiella emersonii ATCC 22665]